MPRIEKECPRCKGERGKWLGLDFVESKIVGRGTWHPCQTCRTKGVVRVASTAEYRRLEHNVKNPGKVSTKQREKEK
jgi:hypothetical protein